MRKRLSFQRKFHIDPFWCAWFSGFIDGEGSFLIGLQKPKNGGRVRVRPYLQLKLREDDSEILREITEILRCGHVYKYSYHRNRMRGGKDADQFAWIVGRRSELLHIIIPLLEAYPLRTKKLRDFEIWSQCVFMLQSNGASSELLDDLLNLKYQLEFIRKHPSQRYRLVSEDEDPIW